MANTALNRTTQVLLTNKSGGNLNYGDVVALDNTNANGFTTTTTSALSTRGLGVILEPNGIANNASGMVAVGGWCPKINLNTAAGIGQFIKTHTVAGQGTPHASPQVEGDFAVALTASATPPCNLFGSPNGAVSGGSGTVTHTAGALTASAVVVGNGTDDIKVLASLGTTVTVLHGNAAGLPTFGAVALATDVSGVLPGANGGNWVLLSTQTASSSASLDFTSIITSTYDDYVFEVVGLVPATTSTNLNWRGSVDNGLNWDSGSNYAYVGIVQGVGGGGTFGSASATFGSANKLNNMVNTSTKPISGTFFLRAPLSTSLHKTLGGHIDYWDTAPNIVTGTFSSSYLSATAMNAIQFFMNDSGGTVRNMTSGVIRGYGISK